MKIALVFPRLTESSGQLYTDSIVSRVIKPLWGLGEMNITPPLSLLMLAAVTPLDHELTFVDERVEPVPFDDMADLVGISVVTRSAPGAYRIADEYRKRGARVVLGGVHPSVMPQEAGLHADAVVIGEGEGVWPQIIEESKRGCLQRLYRGGHGADLSTLPRPRRDIIRHPEKYGTIKVAAASRGCPNSCSFCAAGVAVGKRYRTRPVRDVIEELESLPGRYVFFADDNLGWDVAYAKALLRALIPLKLRWAGELSLSALEDTELVDLVAKSGCTVLGIGFESVSPTVIAAIRKHQTNDPSRYPELVRRLHRNGVPIVGHFIIGFDQDDPTVFRKTEDFIAENNIEMPSVNTLIPYPGTSIFQEFDRTGRLYHKNWTYYDTQAGYVVYRLAQLTPHELVDGYLTLTRRIHSTRAVLERLGRAHTLFSVGAIPALHFNFQSLRSIRQDVKRMSRSQDLAETGLAMRA